MATATKRQDMPPKGGYKSIVFARNPARTYFTGYQMIAGYAVMTAAAAYVYYLTDREIRRDQIEMRSGKFAIMPLLIAERDREYLKQIRRNREEEADLMKNVKDWKVGTWFGEPIYKLASADQWIDPSFKEFYVHTPHKEMAKRAHLKLWS